MGPLYNYIISVTIVLLMMVEKTEACSDKEE
jgi:hypothetical protein